MRTKRHKFGSYLNSFNALLEDIFESVVHVKKSLPCKKYEVKIITCVIVDLQATIHTMYYRRQRLPLANYN